MINLSSLTSQLKGKAVLIMGLGKSGIALGKTLKAAKVPFIAWDDDEKQRREALSFGLEVGDFSKVNFTNVAFVVLAPGIPLTHPKPHPIVEKAKAAGKEIICDIEVFYRAKPSVITVGVTGTNGKSTTTALIGHILNASGRHAEVGGNIGTPVMELNDNAGRDAIYVLELSSFQLDLCPTFAPRVSVLLNIGEDHLDRHGTMINYVKAKSAILKGSGTAVIGLDDEWSKTLAQKTVTKNQKRQVIPISVSKKTGIYVTNDGVLTDSTLDNGRKIIDLKTCKNLQGTHNWQNAAAAYAACRALGVDGKTIVQGLMTFPGLAHRQNIVAKIGGVSYINDSKATNDQAASMALRTFQNIYWIAGGKPKSDNYPECEPYLKNIRRAFLIGSAEERMAQWLTEKKVPHTRCETLKNALSEAHKIAQVEQLPGATVLLSPACASYDQFKNFEERGDIFVKYVKQLLEMSDRYGQNAAGGKKA